MNFVNLVNNVLLLFEQDSETVNFTRSDFFDFYALEYAGLLSTDYGKELVDKIHNDLFVQLAAVAVNRINEDYDRQTKQYWEFNDPEADAEYYTPTPAVPTYRWFVVDHWKLDYLDHRDPKRNYMDLFFKTSKAVILDLIRAALKEAPVGYFTGKTWRGILSELENIGKNSYTANQKILSIDRMFNMTHHSGSVIDFLKQNPWLKQALDYRQQANERQILTKSSSFVKDLISNAAPVIKYNNLQKNNKNQKYKTEVERKFYSVQGD